MGGKNHVFHFSRPGILYYSVVLGSDCILLLFVLFSWYLGAACIAVFCLLKAQISVTAPAKRRVFVEGRAGSHELQPCNTVVMNAWQKQGGKSSG